MRHEDVTVQLVDFVLGQASAADGVLIATELYLYLRREADTGIRREGRDAFLANIINQCYELTGYLDGSMSMDDAYSFIRLGRSLERADMITRIVDVGCLNLVHPKTGVTVEYSNILWMNVLRSLNAYQMYRQHVQDTVNGEDVVDYLLKDSNQLLSNVRKVLAPSKQKFTPEQAQSVTQMMEDVATVGGAASDRQRELLTAVANELSTTMEVGGKW